MFESCVQNGAGPWEALQPASLSKQRPLDGLTQALRPIHHPWLLGSLQAVASVCREVGCPGLGSGRELLGSSALLSVWPPGPLSVLPARPCARQQGDGGKPSSCGPTSRGAASLAGLTDRKHTKKWGY